MVATCDVHYVNKQDATAQDILLCVQTNRKVQETDRMNLMDFDLSLRSPEEVLAGFPDHPEVLENRITSYNVCYTKLLRIHCIYCTASSITWIKSSIQRSISI